MPIYAIGDKVPQIHPDAWVAPTASIVGDVVIHEGASVWYNAVIRGDTSFAVVGPGANVQDGAVVHGRANLPAVIEAGASVAHNAVVHGARIGERTIVANGAIVLDGATIGPRTLVAAGALVPPGTEIPGGVLVVGVPAKVRGPIEPGSTHEKWLDDIPGIYSALVPMHRNDLREIPIELAPAPRKRR
jgi:carbonic anhydrase/acetyltransferase-like protein (isoleucine patch superfamily)